jgi:hypothetical protein
MIAMIDSTQIDSTLLSDHPDALRPQLAADGGRHTNGSEPRQ